MSRYRVVYLDGYDNEHSYAQEAEDFDILEGMLIFQNKEEIPIAVFAPGVWRAIYLEV